MKRFLPITLAGCIFLILTGLISGCNLPIGELEQGGGQPETQAATWVALTVQAVQQTEAAEQDQLIPTAEVMTETLPPASTDKPLPEPSATASQTPTASLTPTPEQARVHLSENTNCRTGPGSVYELLSILYKGDESEAVAQDPTGDFWYIRNPKAPPAFCWLWGNYATPEGDTASLPVFTPPPTPTHTPTVPAMDFKISYTGRKANCSSSSIMLVYQITNTGSITLESWKTTAIDHTGGTVSKMRSGDKFQDVSSFCLVTSSQEDLTPGESHYILAFFVGDPTGHDLTLEGMICSQNGLSGNCTIEKYRHTP